MMAPATPGRGYCDYWHRTYSLITVTLLLVTSINILLEYFCALVTGEDVVVASYILGTLRI